MTKTADDAVKEATKRKPDQHILLKVQDTDLAAREALVSRPVITDLISMVTAGVAKCRVG